MPALSIEHIVNSEEISGILITPCMIPFEMRRDIAICLASHLLSADGHDGNGPDIVKRIVSSKEWAHMKDIVRKSDLMPKLILKTVLTSLFASSGKNDNEDAVSKVMRSSWDHVSLMARTMDIIASLSSVSGFSYSVRDAHRELITNIPRYRNLLERNDDLEQVAEIMKFMGSEMIGHVFHGDLNVKRDVLMIIDTSKSMYGEPDLIAKALALSVTKQMTRHKGNVNVSLFSSGLPFLSLSDGRDMMDMISFAAGNGEQFTGALKLLLERMKQNAISDIDIILVSKGAEVISDPNFTRDWESFRKSRNIRVITAVASGDNARALTELSDHVTIFNDHTIRSKGTEFVKLINALMS
jgi:uncharacterized protein with von Willebrand factor type A (vWA) domain